MKENDYLFHVPPAIKFLLFCRWLLLFTMFNQHPVFLGISYAGAFVIRRIAEWMAKDPEAGSVADTSGTSDHSIAESYV